MHTATCHRSDAIELYFDHRQGDEDRAKFNEWLHQAMSSTGSLRPGYPARLIGLQWIERHPKIFMARVPSEERFSFFVKFIEIPGIEEIILDPGLLECVPEEDRFLFIAQVIRQHDVDPIWPAVALQVGISRAGIATLILDMLRRGKGIPPFLNGYGHINKSRSWNRPELWRLTDEESMWAMLKPFDFCLALRHCWRHRPGRSDFPVEPIVARLAAHDKYPGQTLGDILAD